MPCEHGHAGMPRSGEHLIVRGGDVVPYHCASRHRLHGEVEVRKVCATALRSPALNGQSARSNQDYLQGRLQVGEDRKDAHSLHGASLSLDEIMVGLVLLPNLDGGA